MSQFENQPSSHKASSFLHGFCNDLLLIEDHSSDAESETNNSSCRSSISSIEVEEVHEQLNQQETAVEKHGKFTKETYTNIEAFLDQEGLYLMCPEDSPNCRARKPFIQLKTPILLKSRGKKGEGNQVTNQQVVPSFLEKRRLLLLNEERSSSSLRNSSYTNDNIALDSPMP